MRKMTITGIALAAMTVFTMAAPALAGEAFVTKARGSTITIDKGADDGLEVGLEVVVVRPPDEAVIHPLTGENLGSPEMELVIGQVSKVSARAASVTLMSPPLLALRSGDVARFMTVEEKMVLDQEMSTETAEKAASERTRIRSEAGKLARNISSIQGTIRGLERAIRDLRRYDDDVVKPQFNSINRQIAEMREELGELRTTVSLLNSVPIGDPGMEGEAAMSQEEVEALRILIQDEIDKLSLQMAAVAPPPPVGDMEPPPVDPDLEMPPLEEETPFFLQAWFIVVLGALGIAGIAFFAYMKMAGDDDEDDEDDEDEEIIEEVDEDDDDEIEVDVEEEEDDIVVEETS
ncbi:MAG: hypothetical protein HN712_18700 [Gemmatimonadetes bacterium]|nr:hypothetical protein [Gemmatimonadota bacterium]